MSDTTTGTTATASTLTGAAAAVYTALTASPGITAADLAVAAGVGRSTAGKALAALEQRGLATRTPGAQHNGRCLPDHWRAAPAVGHQTGNSDDHRPQVQPSAQPAPPTTGGPQTVADSAHLAPVAQTPQGAGQPSKDSSSEDASDRQNSNRAPRPEETSAPQISTEPQTAPAHAAPSPGGKERLAPGALRQMVTQHLQAHPDKTFTATAISRAIDKSSGAIANALVILVKHGIAEQVNDAPRTYRSARRPDAGTA